ncbi:MAG: MarR family transcriptional regulator [Acidobacteriota bacterium]|nr:MarR family transcriptional regulator [Acidobacteriota bacterium]
MSGRQLAFDPIAEARRQWDQHWRSQATPQMVAVTSIMRAQQILLQRLNALLEPLDLTFPRYETLMVLYYSRRGELPLGKLSDRLQVHRASVTNVIDKLETSGYVVRVAHARDRRTTLARISDCGRTTAERATRALNDAAFAIDPLAAESCESLFALLEPLRRAAGDF